MSEAAGAAWGRAQREAPYLDALVDYAERRPGRFHVPGPQGRRRAPIRAWSRRSAAAAFDHDIPAGIEGIDVGQDSPFQQAQRLAAEAWGARRSWFLINGASQGNHAACLALRHAGAPWSPAQRPLEHDRRDHPRRARAGVRRSGARPASSASPTA